MKGIALITGANGFVGRRVVQVLANNGWQVRAAVRSPDSVLDLGNLDAAARARVVTVVVGDLTERTSWTEALAGANAVLHLAARVHVMHESSADPLAEFRRVNVEATRNLARQAVSAGVARLVFMSSIKVNGEETAPGKPFSANDVPDPQDPYGISKLEAERELARLSEETGLEVTVIRPVLVYGPGVKGNFLTMMRVLRRRLPLPFGRVDNRRSLVALDNLVDLARVCLVHPAAPGQTFLVSDGTDLSSSQLLRALGTALGTPAWLLPVPTRLLIGLARMLNRQAVVQRLCGSLQVDIESTRTQLGWRPPVSVNDGLQAAARDFLDGGRRGA